MKSLWKKQPPPVTHILTEWVLTAKQLQKPGIADLLGELFVKTHHHSITLNPSERLKPNKRKLN